MSCQSVFFRQTLSACGCVTPVPASPSPSLSLPSYAKKYKITQQRVWPFPRSITHANNVRRAVVGRRLYASDIHGAGRRLLVQSVIDDFNAYVFFDGVPTLSSSSSLSSQYSVTITSTDTLSTTNVDESYVLDVDVHGRVSITARTYIGACYGLATLQQLIRRTATTSSYGIENAPLHIVDSPAIPYRALMLDCARHFLPLEVIKRQVRAMALQKLNALHLHLTDGQSVSVAVGPYTTQLALRVDDTGNTGAYSADEVYTAADVADLVTYARDRGIQVIPEIDTPGHSFAWSCGFPDIMTCNGDGSQGQATCPEPPCGFLNLADELAAVKHVVSNVLTEVVAAFKLGQAGFGRVLHLGFDEVGCPNLDSETGDCMSPSCVNAYGENSVTYLTWLLQWMTTSHPSVTSMMWVDQVISSNFPGGGATYSAVVPVDPSRVILQFWTLNETLPAQLAELISQGFRIVNSQATTYYLDAGGEGNQSYYGGPLITTNKITDEPTERVVAYQKYWMSMYPGVGGIVNSGWPVAWEDIYLNNVSQVSTDIGKAVPAVGGYVQLPMAANASSAGIIGAEACLWGEQTDELNIETRLWPKAAAFAETLWRFDKDQPADNVVNARFRLAFAREDILRLGVAAAPVSPGDMFRNAPWGPLQSATTSLMYNINLPTQQVPEGYQLNFTRFWGVNLACGDVPINPFCGSFNSATMRCDGDPDAAPYVQAGCPYPPSGPV